MLYCDRCGDKIDLKETGESAPSIIIDGDHLYCSARCYTTVTIENKRHIKFKVKRVLKWLRSIW